MIALAYRRDGGELNYQQAATAPSGPADSSALQYRRSGGDLNYRPGQTAGGSGGDTDPGTDDTPPAYRPPVSIISQTRSGWTGARLRRQTVRSGTTTGTDRHVGGRIGYTTGRLRYQGTAARWNSARLRLIPTATGWTTAKARHQPVRSGWTQPPLRLIPSLTGWTTAADRHQGSAVAWTSPGLRHVAYTVAYTGFSELVHAPGSIGWTFPPFRHVDGVIRWGQRPASVSCVLDVPVQTALSMAYQRPGGVMDYGRDRYPPVCTRDDGSAMLYSSGGHYRESSYSAPDRERFDNPGSGDQAAPDTGNGNDNGNGNGNGNGGPIDYGGGPQPVGDGIVTSGTHTVTATRLSDGAAISLAGLSIDCDQDSFVWSCNLTLASYADAALLEVSATGPEWLQLTLNGHAWRFLAERPTESEQFNQRRYSVTGRTPTAQMAAPYSLPMDGIEDDARTAQQLALQALEFSGVDLSYLATDWLVPAGVFDYGGRTPVEVLQRIAEAGGNIVQSHPSEALLMIRPRWPGKPGAWDVAPVATFNRGDALTWSTAWAPSPDFNAVVVAGTTAGVVVNAKKRDTAGDRPAPSISEPLCTTVDAGRSRASQRLTNTGNAIEVTATFPFMPGDPRPWPGELVAVNDYGNVSWSSPVVNVRYYMAGTDPLQLRMDITLRRLLNV